MFCVILALPAWFLGNLFPLVGAPVFAILLGMVMGNFHNNRTQTTDGIAFTSKYILQAAVVLLGFGLNLTQVFKVGTQSLPIIISTIAVSLVVAFLLQKWLKLDSNIAILVGVGSSICGGSAIAATAPVIKAKDEEVAKSISVIFLFNIRYGDRDSLGCCSRVKYLRRCNNCEINAHIGHYSDYFRTVNL